MEANCFSISVLPPPSIPILQSTDKATASILISHGTGNYLSQLLPSGSSWLVYHGSFFKVNPYSEIATRSECYSSMTRNLFQCWGIYFKTLVLSSCSQLNYSHATQRQKIQTNSFKGAKSLKMYSYQYFVVLKILFGFLN